MLEYMGGLGSLPLAKKCQSRSINAENPHGEKGAGCKTAGPLGEGRKGCASYRDFKPGTTITLAEIEGPGIINHIWMTVRPKTSDAHRYVLRNLILRMYWDGEETPSVEVPLGDFFCCGFAKACTVISLPICVLPNRGMNCYFSMPFRKKALITMESQHEETISCFFYQIDYCLPESLPDDICYFHAQWRRQKQTELAKDYIVLDGVKGKGHYVGTYLALQTLERYWWGEGEFKFYIDGDDKYPTLSSTGSEDYFGGAWSFGVQKDGVTIEQNYCAPYMGYPYYSAHDEDLSHINWTDDVPPMRGLYRWHIQDPICFEDNIRVTLQQIGGGFGGLFERQDDVSTVAYWYQQLPHVPFPALPSARERWPR